MNPDTPDRSVDLDWPRVLAILVAFLHHSTRFFNLGDWHVKNVDTFKWAWKAGMYPSDLNDIKVVGEKIETVRQQFRKPQVVPCTMIADWYGPPCG